MLMKFLLDFIMFIKNVDFLLYLYTKFDFFDYFFYFFKVEFYGSFIFNVCIVI